MQVHHHHHHHHNSHHQRHKRSYSSARHVLINFGFQFPHDFKLGSGRYSKVYKGFYREANRYFAIKITDLEAVSDRFKHKFVPRELKVWRELSHPNHVRLYKDFMKNDFLFEIIDLAVGGDMLNYLRNHGPVKEAVCSGWMLQLVDALSYLHQKRIVHRDLKLENILIFDGDVIKITDYGFCKQCCDDELSSTFCGTKSYKAPEILQSTDYDPFKADVWSLGIVGYVMLTNRMPFRGDVSTARLVEAQRSRRYRFPSQMSVTEHCRCTIDNMLTFEPGDRPSIFDVRNLPWFASAVKDANSDALS
ncbi:hypothetical protein niasHT_033479 [Heterodera trifolii]|uniref:Protein kinase domain-containing protein n=1 Tax=Heterodera trifolii TaxID=157864 RepID=A0ABD2J3U4_9BILA